MGDLIRFPQERRPCSTEDYRAEPAIILILPVVRIERDPIHLIVEGGSPDDLQQALVARRDLTT